MSVARPTKWGNPFTIALALETAFAADEQTARQVVVECFRDWLYKGFLSEWWFSAGKDQWTWMREHLVDLAFRDLACWCSIDQPCHADVLLEAADMAWVNGGG